MIKHKTRWLSAFAALLLMLGALPQHSSYAQGNSRTFPETGKTVSGRFLDYWNRSGGLSQQGYPISEEMQERSDTDGQVYTVQYFERAIFERHPENAQPYDVLLSLLGTFLSKQKYPSGAPAQVANTQPGSRLFAETNHRVGGVFLDYWNRNGGLSQQGYPISEEFNEVSDLDGKTYRVQYFERAVFEFHPENQPPYNVLLSQLGKFRYLAKYSAGAPRPTQQPGPQPPPPGPAPRPTATTAPAPPPPPASGCNLPANRNAASNKTSVRAGESIRIAAAGFTPGEPVSFWFTLPTQDVFGTARPLDPGLVNPDGTIGPLDLPTSAEFAAFPGTWALTFQGAYSSNVAVLYFCVVR